MGYRGGRFRYKEKNSGKKQGRGTQCLTIPGRLMPKMALGVVASKYWRNGVPGQKVMILLLAKTFLGIVWVISG